MLKIEIPSYSPSGVNFNELEKYAIPAPSNGFNPEINNNVVISFEDEQDAINYAHDLDAYAYSIDHASKEYLIIADIIKAIGNDEFVQSYIES